MIEIVEFLPDEARQGMPQTRPDSDALEHKTRCRCDICQRPNILGLNRTAAAAAARKVRRDEIKAQIGMDSAELV